MFPINITLKHNSSNFLGTNLVAKVETCRRQYYLYVQPELKWLTFRLDQTKANPAHVAAASQHLKERVAWPPSPKLATLKKELRYKHVRRNLASTLHHIAHKHTRDNAQTSLSLSSVSLSSSCSVTSSHFLLLSFL